MINKPNPLATTTFGLIRHGKTEWNSIKKIQGSANSPLTQEGKELTEAWLPTLSKFTWDRILASDLGRVKETVEILNQGLNLPTTYDKRLREQDWGEWEGLTIPYIQENFTEELQERVAMGWGFSAPGGESRHGVKQRVLQALEDAAEKWPDEKILVVCHQGVIKCSLYHITNRKFVPAEDPLLKHNSLHLIEYRHGSFVIRQLNLAR